MRPLGRWSSAASPHPASNVLVVDDEQIVREVVARHLRREGYRSLEAGDGASARYLIERDPPALIVLVDQRPGGRQVKCALPEPDPGPPPAAPGRRRSPSPSPVRR